MKITADMLKFDITNLQNKIASYNRFGDNVFYPIFKAFNKKYDHIADHTFKHYIKDSNSAMSPKDQLLSERDEIWSGSNILYFISKRSLLYHALIDYFGSIGRVMTHLRKVCNQNCSRTKNGIYFILSKDNDPIATVLANTDLLAKLNA